MKIQDIENPLFLKNMTKEELKYLSEDIRTFLLENISKTGGHLSSNLGIVDLTVAIHKVFNSPQDKIIFDVGHQSYPHKILTGRAKKFEALRKYNGLSGFQKRNESEHDVYEAGHSSTSLSAALGFAIARDMDSLSHHVIAVIGDGSIANGLAYEAINHIGAEQKKLIIILNDNEMSISKNVGALHNMLDKIRINYTYNNAKLKTKRLLNKIPFVGKLLSKFVGLIKQSIKKVYSKDGFLFEELGLKYFGPINGHDFDEMINYLEMLKKLDAPVILHVITEKGKGYNFAEMDIEGVWHGVNPFDVKTGASLITKKDEISWSEIVCNHLVCLNKVLKDIIVISPAMTAGSKLKKFKKMYPNNFFDVGIAEEHAMVLASGLAVNNKRVFVSIYSTFLQRGYDEVLHDIARMNLPVVIGIDRAGLADGDGETHHGIYDVAFLSHIPNMIIAVPKDSIQAGKLLYTAFNTKAPFAIRYSRLAHNYQDIEYEQIKIGSWEQLSSGKDLTIITYGDFISNAFLIRELLLKDGIEAEIVNARFIKPFDYKYMDKLINKNKMIFVYEEVAKIGSLGQMLCNYVLEKGFDNQIICLSIKDEFIPHGERNELLRAIKLDARSVYKNILNKLKEIDKV